MVETATWVALIQLVLTVGGILYTVVSWVNDGAVARSVRSRIGMDDVADRVGEIKDSVDETQADVHQIEERMDSVEKGMQGIVLEREREDMNLNVEVYLSELSDEGRVSVLDFVEDQFEEERREREAGD